jgi:hypothetical protein
MTARSIHEGIQGGLATAGKYFSCFARSRWFWIALSLVIAGIVLLPLLLLAAGFSNFAASVSWFSKDLLKETSLDPIIARVLAGLLAAGMCVGLKFALSRDSGMRLRGMTILVSVFVLYNAGLYALTRQTFFAPDTGHARKWYAVTPDGVRFSDRSGVESQYGIAFKPVTPEILPALLRWHGGLATEVQVRDAKFFDPATGAAVVWYRSTASGSYRFFNGPGFDPTDAEPLQPVTREIAFAHQQATAKSEDDARRAQSEEEQRAARERIVSLLNPDCFSGRAAHSVAVSFISAELASVSPYQAHMLSAMTDIFPVVPLFRPEAFEGNSVAQLLEEKSDEFKAVMEKAKISDWLIGILSLEFADQSTLQSGLVTAHITASFRSQEDSLRYATSKGAGFGQQAAVATAIRNLITENQEIFTPLSVKDLEPAEHTGSAPAAPTFSHQTNITSK